MTEPTQEQYAAFGEAVAGLLDGYTFDSEGYTEDEKNYVLAQTVQMAARVYGIEPQKDEA